MTVMPAPTLPPFLRHLVVPGSTPVISFGDPGRAWVATLGINPSWREFLDKASVLLKSPSRRLVDVAALSETDALGPVPDPFALTAAEFAEVVAGCNAYFGNRRTGKTVTGTNPYRKWFNPLDRVLSVVANATYYDGSASHLDLIQWATCPVWSGIKDADKMALLADGVPRLRQHLAETPVKLVLLNGATVVNQVKASGIATLTCDPTPIAFGKPGKCGERRSCLLFSGKGTDCLTEVRFIGWSTNLQSARGVTKAFRTELAERLKALVDAPSLGGLRTTKKTPTMLSPTGSTPSDPWVQALTDFLAARMASQEAGAKTIGKSFTFYVTGLGKFVLKKDTKSTAAENCLKTPDKAWRVVGNKLQFSVDSELAKGWYCYLV